MSKEPLLNSDKEVPKTKSALLDKYQKEESKRLDPESIQSVIDELPTPSIRLKVSSIFESPISGMS